MSETTPAPDETPSPEDNQADIEATRERLDVKAQASEAVHDAGAKVSGAVSGAKQSVTAAAGTAASSAVEGSRTLVQQFRALPLATQAVVGAGVAALVVTLIVRSARS